MTGTEQITHAKVHSLPPGYRWKVVLHRRVALVELHRERDKPPRWGKLPVGSERVEFTGIYGAMTFERFSWLRQQIINATHEVYVTYTHRDRDFSALDTMAQLLQGELNVDVKVERD